MISLWEITIWHTHKLDGGEQKGIALESPKEELEEKVWMKFSAFVEGKTTVMTSEETKRGKEEKKQS